MQFLIDHLSAILVGSVVLLILVGVSFGAQRGAIEATEADARFGAAGALAEMLEADLPNLGAGVAPADDAVLALEGTATITTALEFRGAVEPSAAAPVVRVRYELHEVGTVGIGTGDDAETVPAYEVRRRIHDGSAFQAAGTSRAAVTEFSVRLLDDAGTPVGADLDAARVAEVSIAFASPLGRGGSGTVSRWQRRFQLTNLADG